MTTKVISRIEELEKCYVVILGERDESNEKIRWNMNILWTEMISEGVKAVSYTHLRAHETVLDLVCRLLLEKKKLGTGNSISICGFLCSKNFALSF